MKKIFLFALVLILNLVISLKTFANWEKVTIDEDGNTFFIDYTNIRKVNHNVYWWDLTNYKNKYNGSFSFVSYNIADCKSYGIKSFELVWYDQKWGKGNIVHRKDNMNWMYPKPSTIFYTIIDKVCKYKK